MKNNSKKDTVKKITKKHIIIAIIIMVLIITTTFGAVILLQNNKSNENIQLEETNNNDNSENNETNENENSTPTDQEESQNSEKQEKPKKIIELYVEINKDSYEYTRVNELSLMGKFYDKYYYKNKVIISELPLEAKLLIIASNLNLNATDCGGYDDSETICVLKQESFERAYSLLFNEKPKEDIKNINYEGDPYTIKYNDKVDGLIFTEAPYGFEGCNSYFEEVITSSKTNENQIEYITATMYFDLPKDENYSCTEYVDLYSDIEMTKLISSTIKQGTEKREGLKNINKLNQYKYIFKYSEEIERYYFYSVEKIN